MRNLGWLVLGIGIAALACVLWGLSGSASAWQSGDAYSGSGDWVVDDPTIVANEYLVVDGDIDIQSTLTVYSSAILIDQSSDGEFTINVASGGTLNLYGSWIGSDDSYHYKFTVYGNLHINQSDVSDMWGDTGSWVGGIQLYSGSSATIENSWIYYGMTGGIYIDTCSPTIRYNYILYNGIDGGSTTYCYGIYVTSNGGTSASITYNEIFENYYHSGSRYGTGLRSEGQSQNDVISDNYIYDNGFSTSTTPAGYQIYLYNSAPTLQDNYLYNGRYQLYADSSSPPSITGGTMSSYVRGTSCYNVYATGSTLSFDSVYFTYTYFSNTFYGIYATSYSPITVKDCNFVYTTSGSSTRYNIYASTYSPVDVSGSYFMNMYGGAYNGIYASSYCPVTISDSYFNVTSTTSSPSFAYGSTYSPFTISTTTYEATGTWSGSNFFQGTSYCQFSLDRSSVEIWLLNPTSSYTFYVFQVRNYSDLYFNYSTMDFHIGSLSSASNPYIYLFYNYGNSGYNYKLQFDHSDITYHHPSNWASSGGYNYIIYSYYNQIYIGNTTIRDLNDPFRYTYFMYAYYTRSITIDYSDINIHTYRAYYLYSYIYGSSSIKTDVYILNTTMILNNTTPYSTYTSPQMYWYNYYCGHFSMIDSHVELYGGYYIYFYNYGYSGRSGQELYLIDSTLISKTLHYYPQSTTSQYNYVYFYYFHYATVDHFYLDARSGYYMYFYIYAYYSQQNAQLSVTNSTFDIDCKDSVQTSSYYAYAYLYWYYFTTAYIDHITTNIKTSYYCYLYLYGYSSANTKLTSTNNVYNVDATYSQYAPYYYGMIYAYHYYWKNAYINNNVYNFNTNYYAYVYMYGYSGSNTNLVCTNNTYNLDAFTPGVTYYGYCMVYHYYYENALVENNYYNVDTGYYIYNYFYYLTNGVVRNNVYDIKQSVPTYGTVYGYLFYMGGSGRNYKVYLENLTVNYTTYGTATGSNPYLYYAYNCEAHASNVTINLRNADGIIPVTPFYVYYGSLLELNNCTIDAAYGENSPGGSSPAFPLAYIYNYGTQYPPATLNITDTTIDVKMYNEFFNHYGFYIRGSNDGVNLLNSVVRWNVSSPGTTCQVFRFDEDPSYTGKLNQLMVVGSTLQVDVNAPGSMVSLLRMGGGASIGDIIVKNANLAANFYVASDNPTSLVQLIGLKDVTLRDLVLNCNAPAGSDMVLNGIRMERSNAEITNIIVKGNGHGRTSGIICDLASTPLIHDVYVSNAWAGIQSVFFSRPTVTENVTFDNCRAGIYLESNGNITLAGSTISDCALGLQVEDGSWATVIDSAFTNNVQDMELNGTSTAWLLNSTFTPAKVRFGDDKSMLLVNWWLQLRLTWSNAQDEDSGIIVPQADIVLKDNGGREYMRAMTDDSGIVGWFTAAEYSQMLAGKTMYSPYTVEVDYRGFSGQDSVTVDTSKEVTVNLKDDSLPEIHITYPAEGRIQNFREVILQGICSDLGSGLSRLSFNMDGGEWMDGGRATEAWSQLMDVPEGEHRLGVRVTDMSGNPNETYVGVIIDLTPPAIVVTSPEDRSLGNRIGVDLVGTVEKGSVLTVNRRPVDVDADGRFTYGVRLVEGQNDFSLFAVDRAGNTNSLTWTLFLDITPPPLLLTGPADGLLTNQDSVMVTGKTEPGALVTLNGDEMEIQPDGSFSFRYDLRSGPNTITVEASDIAGNRASRLRTVVMDNEVRLDVSYPTDNMVTNQITLVVQGETDTDVLLRLNDGLVTVAADGTFSVTYTLTEGSNELTFTVRDRAGNTALLTRRVVLDTVPPTLELQTPQAGALLRTTEVTVEGACEPGMTLTVNGEPVGTDTGRFSRTLTLPEGTNLLVIAGSDAAGNTVSVEIPVLLDMTAPSLTLVEPSDGFRTRDFSVIVVGITEPGASVTVNGLAVMVDPFGKFTTTVTLQKGANDIEVVSADSAGNTATTSIAVTGTSEPAAAEENTWWWAAVGLVVGLGIMLPLMAVLAGVALRGETRKGGEK